MHACFDILPTRVNLLCRKVHIYRSTVYPLWTTRGDHWPHSLGMPLCPQYMGLSPRKIQKCNSEASCFYLLDRQMLDRLPKKELETWAMTVWSLRNARNKFHFEHIQTHPMMIVRRASSLLEEYRRHMAALPH